MRCTAMKAMAAILFFIAAYGRAEAAISYGDVWYMENGGQVVLLSGTDGSLIAKTTDMPSAKTIGVSPDDGSLYVGSSDGIIYHVLVDGTYSVFCDLSADPTGNVPAFTSLIVNPVSQGGGLYVKSDLYGDWALYKIKSDGTVEWAICHGRADGSHNMALDRITGNVLLSNGFNSKFGVYSKYDGSRIGIDGMSTTGPTDIYQMDGTFWVGASSGMMKFAPDGGSGMPDATYSTSSIHTFRVNQNDKSVWLAHGTGTSGEIVHIDENGNELGSYGLGNYDTIEDLEYSYTDDTVWVADYRHRNVVQLSQTGLELARYTSVSNSYIKELEVYNPPLDLTGATSTGRPDMTRAALGTGIHPRVFFTTADLADIRSRVTQYPWSMWYSEVKADADAALVAPVPVYDNLNAPAGTWVTRVRNASYLSFVGNVEDDPAYIKKAILLLTYKRWQTGVVGYGSEMVASDIGTSMGLAYDQVYFMMNDVEKMGVEWEMEQVPASGFAHMEEGGWYSGWGWGNNVGTKVVGGMGVIAMAIGPSNTTWANDYYQMTDAMIDWALDNHFDSDGVYSDSQGYLATGWYNCFHALLAMKKCGYTDYFADTRFILFNKVNGLSSNPMGVALQFEDCSLTGGYMCMTTFLPICIGQMPASENQVKSWMKQTYLNVVDYHPYRIPYNGEDIKYRYSTYDAPMAICAVDVATWNAVTPSAPPNTFTADRYPNGGFGHFIWRSGYQPFDDMQINFNADWNCGWPYSSHEHMDNGAIEMYAYGTRLLVSPGYTKSSGDIYLNWQDSTLANSLLIADRDDDGVFETVDDRQLGGQGWNGGNGASDRAMGDQIGFASGKFDWWYDSGSDGNAYKRNIFFIGKSTGNEPYAIVIDDVDQATAPLTRKYAITWHCRGNMTLDALSQSASWTVPSEVATGDDVTLDIKVIKPEGLTCTEDNGPYYPFFGSADTGWEDDVHYLVASTNGTVESDSYRFMSVLYPRKLGQSLPAISGVPGENAATVGGADLVFTQDGTIGTVTVEGVTTDAEMAFVRKAGSDNVDGFIAKRGSSLDFSGAGFSSTDDVTIALMNFGGAVETYSDNVTITIDDPDITLPVSVTLDGTTIANMSVTGQIQFTVPTAGHYKLEMTIGNIPPVAVIDMTPQPAEGYAPLAVTLSASNSTDDGTITTYEWDFHYDGVNFSAEETGTTATNYTYTSEGSYLIALRVTDDQGASHIDTESVLVYPDNSPPVAELTASPVSGNAPLYVAFDATASYDPDADPMTFEWDFDYDGTTFDVMADTGSTGVVTWRYEAVDSYTCAVRVSDSGGLTDIETINININLGDADSDGIPDWWEIEHFGNVTACDPAGDPDNDAFSNLQEYQADSDPFDNDTDNDGLLDGADPFPLIPAGTGTYPISGTVTGPTSDAVTLNLTGDAMDTQPTNGSGGYLFTNLNDGSYVVTPAPKVGYEFSPASFAVAVNGAGVDNINFTISLSSTGGPSGPFTISGTLSGPNNAGIVVTLSGDADDTTSTAGDGTYSFTGLSAGSYAVTVTGETGYEITPIERLVSLSANASSVDFTKSAIVPETYDIAGTISGTSVYTGVTVNLSGDATDTATPDAGGAYSFGSLAAGSYRVSVSAPGFDVTPPERWLTIAGDASGVDFAMAEVIPGSYTISGTLSGATDYSGMTVSLSGDATADVTPNAAGFYSFTALNDGEYTITVTAVGYTIAPNASRSVSLAGANLGGQDFTLTEIVAQTWTISGTVASTVTDVAGFMVTLSGSGSGTVTLASDGTYSFTGLSDGNYTVTVDAPGFAVTPPSFAVTVNGENVAGLDADVVERTVIVKKESNGACAAGESRTGNGATAAALLLALAAFARKRRE